MARDTQAEGDVERCDLTMDLFSDFSEVKAKPTEAVKNDPEPPKGRPQDFAEIIKFDEPIPDPFRQRTQRPSNEVEKPEVEEQHEAPERPKRDLTMDDQGWRREFIPDLNDFSYLSNSRIKAMLDSPRHFSWKYVRKIKDEDTDAKRLGRIVHSAILEPDKFQKQHIVLPEFSGKGSKAAKEEFIASLPTDAIILKEKEVDKILYMIDSVLDHKKASKVLKDANFELNGYVWDERHELWWLIKPDALKTTLIGDLKTSKSAQPDDFSRDVFTYKYFIQTPIYLDQGSKLLGKKLTHFPFIVIENTPPYICEVYKVSDVLVEQGRQLVDMAVNSYKFHMAEWRKALERGEKYFWPGYTGQAGVTEINIPQWAQYRLEAIELAHIG